MSATSFGSHEVEVYVNDNENFVNWRNNNTDAFICNAPKPSKKDDRKIRLVNTFIHRSDCRHILPNKNGEQHWTNAGYFKICSHSFSSLEKWFHKNVDLPENWEFQRCSTCFPVENEK